MLKKWFLSQSVGIIINPTKSTTPKFNLLLQRFSLKYYCSTTTSSESESESDTHPLPVSYLINNIGFSTQSALKAFNEKRVRFNNIEKPNSVITFFKSHGFSDSNIRIIITKAPWLLSSEPHKRLLPKFQFFLSKGVSSSDIVSLLTANPKILQSSLEKRIVPLFELLTKFMKTNKDVIACLIIHSNLFAPYDLIASNINLISNFGVCGSSISSLLRQNPSLLRSTNVIDILEEVKGLGFDPSLTTFGYALIAKKSLSKKLWDEKVYTFKKWGWSDEDVIEAFRRQPHCMLASIDKINSVMSFWVNQLGWDATAIVRQPKVLGASLERKIKPRASVVQYLLKKGLLTKKASLTTPFAVNEKLFLHRYIICYKEESPYLLKLYAETLNLAHTRNKSDMI